MIEEKHFLPAVLAHDDIRVIFQAALRRLQASSREHLELQAEAAGMVIATAFLSNSPWDDTTTPVNFLYWLYHNDMGKALYPEAKGDANK